MSPETPPRVRHSVGAPPRASSGAYLRGRRNIIRDAMVGLNAPAAGRLIHMAFFIRAWLLVFCWVLLLAPREPHFEPSPGTIALAFVLTIWTAALAVWLPRLMRRTRRRSRARRSLLTTLIGLDLILSFGAFTLAGSWDNAFQIQTYGPVLLTALLLHRFDYGIACGALAFALYLSLPWAFNGISPADVADQGSLAMAMHFAEAYLVWGVGGTWFARLVAQLASRARSLERAAARESADRNHHHGALRITWILEEILGVLSTRDGAVKAAQLATRVQELGRETGVLETPRLPERRSRIKRWMFPTLTDLIEPDQAREWGRSLMTRFSFYLRLSIIGLTPLAFLAGEPGARVSWQRLVLIGLLFAWTLCLFDLSCGSFLKRWIPSQRLASRLPIVFPCHPGWLAVDVVVCFAAILGLQTSSYALVFLGVVPLIFAGALASSRWATVCVAAAVGAHRLILWLGGDGPGGAAASADATVIRLDLTYIAWGFGYLLLTGLIVRLARENGRRADRDARASGMLTTGTALVSIGTIAYDALTDVRLLAPADADRVRTMLQLMLRRAQTRNDGIMPFQNDPDPAHALRELVAIYDLHPTRSVVLHCRIHDIGLGGAEIHLLVEMVEEAVCNAIRHARPGHIVITLEGPPPEWRLTVRDPGSDKGRGTPGGGSRQCDAFSRLLRCDWAFHPGRDEGRWELIRRSTTPDERSARHEHD